MGLAGSCRLPGSPSGVPGRAGASPRRSSRPGRLTSSSPWVARVQVTARRPNAELNSSSSDGAGEGVDGDGDARWSAPARSRRSRPRGRPSGRSCFSVSRSTIACGVVDGLVAGGQDAISGSPRARRGDRSSCRVGVAVVVVASACRARSRPRGARRASASTTPAAADRCRRLPARRALDLDECRDAGATCSRFGGGRPSSAVQLDRPIAGAATQLSRSQSR